MGSDLEQTVEEAIGNADPTAEEIPGAEGGPDSGDSSPNGDPAPTGESVIQAVEGINAAMVPIIAKFRGIELDQRVLELCLLTEAEKDNLRPFAPSAAQYLPEVAKYTPLGMAIGFCLMSGWTIVNKMRILAGIQMSQEARPVKPSPQEKPQPEPEPGAWVANPVESTPPFS